MRTSPRAVSLLAVVLSLLFCFAAQAQDKKGAQDKSNPAYSKALASAMAEYELGNWTEARALFEQAHELNPNARTLRAIGLCAFEEKSYVAAIANLSAALEDNRKPLTAEQRTHATDLLQRAYGFIAQYEVQVSPADAAMRVDLRAPIILNGKLLLDPGTHQLSFSAPGHQSAERTLLARPREGGVLKVELTSNSVASAPPSSVTSSESKEKQAPAPPAPKPEKDEAGRLSVRQKAAIGVAAFGLASLGVGIAFNVIAKSKHDDSGCTKICEDEPSLKLNKEARTAGNVSTIGYAVAGAAVVGSAFMFFWPKPQSEKRVALQVVPDWSRGPSAALHGRF